MKSDRDLEWALDPTTQKIIESMPEWHTRINRQTLIPLYGEWFEFWGIDPQFPERIILERKPSNGRSKK